MSNQGLPNRIFKDGAEPNGERVHHYSELSYIDDIAEALLPDELEKLQNSQFGKVLQMHEGAAYSGKLVHFLLTRQLVVKKKHEIWILFAGSPIRFSISEFQSLTGLRCTKLPKGKTKSGKRKILPGKYWFKLFDRSDVSVEWVVNRLKKKLVGDRDTRLRFALLALVDGVLCPTSGKPKICPTHVELSADIYKFLDYPWGTNSFDMTLTSIQARGAQKLTRKSVTLQGFPYALQLLLLQTVPVIKELHFPEEDQSDDSELEDITNEMVRLWTLKLDLVWKVDGKESCSVTHLLEGPTTSASVPQSIWSDDDDDDSVDRMLLFIKKGKKFSGSMFRGGLLPEEGTDEGTDERNGNSENGSSDESADETNGRKKPSVAPNVKNDKRKGEGSIQDAMKQYVDMKVKRSENRVLKALAEAELRLSHTIAKSISKAQPCKECMQKSIGEGSLPNNRSNDPKPSHPAVAVEEGRNDEFTEALIPPDQVISTILKDLDGGTVGVGSLPKNLSTDPKPSHPALGVEAGRNDEGCEAGRNDESTEALIPPQKLIDANKEIDGGAVKQKKASTKPISHNSLKRKRSLQSEEQECSDKSGSGFFDDVDDQASFHFPSPKRPPINISETAQPPNLKDSEEIGAYVCPLQVPFTEIFSTQETLNVSTSQHTKQHLTVSPLAAQPAAKPTVDESEKQHPPTPSPSTKGPALPCGGLKALQVKSSVAEVKDTKDSVSEVDSTLDSTVEDRRKQVSKESYVNAIVPSNTFGYDLLQLQKIIRITSPDRVIDFGGGRKLSSSVIRDIIELKKDLTNEETDIIFNSLRHSWESDPAKSASKLAAFRDSSFGLSIIQHYTKFWRSSDKGMYEFDNALISSCPLGVEKFYFPFAVEKKYWVCICVDLEEWAITVLDCFVSASRETKLRTALKPLSIMIPYLVRFAGSNSGEKGVDYKPLGIIREKAIPQASYARHSGVMSANLGDAHALGGVALCKLIKITDVFDSAKKYIIYAYEAVNGPA